MTLTADEATFVKRMLPHFMAGKTALEAAQAVLDDDARLVTALADESHCYQGFNDDSFHYEDRVAKGLASHLSEQVYDLLRADN